ncbi:MAG: GNAT family N-acetyltransferase [Jatrophihabitantaceae bacterium]
MPIAVTANQDLSRYEIRVDGEVAGFTRFVPDGDSLVFPHTEIDAKFAGQGLAKTLIRAVLDDVRAQGRKVVALCPFVKSFIEKNPGYQDLLA